MELLAMFKQVSENDKKHYFWINVLKTWWQGVAVRHNFCFLIKLKKKKKMNFFSWHLSEHGDTNGTSFHVQTSIWKWCGEKNYFWINLTYFDSKLPILTQKDKELPILTQKGQIITDFDSKLLLVKNQKNIFLEKVHWDLFWLEMTSISKWCGQKHYFWINGMSSIAMHCLKMTYFALKLLKTFCHVQTSIWKSSNNSSPSIE
jgi:hypothetical protein